jgi:hypothetical protein
VHGATQNTTRLWRPGDVDETRKFIKGEQDGSAVDVLFHLYEPRRVFQLADMALSSLFEIFSRHLSDPSSRQRSKSPAIRPSTASSPRLSPHDYNASRGMADAIADSRRSTCIDGVYTSSARGESDSGLVMALAGDPEGSLQVVVVACGLEKPVERVDHGLIAFRCAWFSSGRTHG